MCISQQAVSGIGLASQVGGSILGAFGSYGKAQATQESLNAQSSFNALRANMYDVQAKSAEDVGQQQEFASGLKTNALMGEQRAALAAHGVDLNQGSALNTLLDTKYMGGVDQATIADNANKEAWALHQSAAIERGNASLYADAASRVSPIMSMGTSLLKDAGPVASSWYKWKNASTAGTPAMPTNTGDY